MRDMHSSGDVADIVAGAVYRATRDFCEGQGSPFLQPVTVDLCVDEHGRPESLVTFVSGIKLVVRVEPVDVLRPRRPWPQSSQEWHAPLAG